jgi:hypothetical protein
MKNRSYNYKSQHLILTAGLVLLALPASLHATDYTWDYTGTMTTSQNWNNASNWSPSGIPGQTNGQVDNIIGFDVSNTANLTSTTNTAYSLGTLNVTPLGGQATATTPTWVIEAASTPAATYSLSISTLGVNPTQVGGTTFTLRDAAASVSTLLNVTVGQLNVYGAPSATTLNLGLTSSATTSGVLNSLDITGGTTFLGSGTSITNLNTNVGNTEELGLLKTDATFSGNATLNLNDNIGNAASNTTNIIATTGLSSDPSATGTVTIVGSAIAATGITITVTSTLDINNSSNYTANFNLIDQTTGTHGRLALTKEGSGTQTLTGVSTYSGGTIITGGTLLANTTGGSATGVGAVAVSGSGTLGGNGTIAPAGASGVSITSGGTLAPGGTQTAVPVGGTPGTSANGNLSLNTTGLASGSTILNLSGAKLTFALGAGTNTDLAGENLTGSQVDIVGAVANTVAFGGTNTVTINDLVGGKLTLNQEYVLIDGNDTTYTGLTYGATTSLGTLITGGLTLLAPGTTGNFFSQWYGTSQLYLQGDNIDVDVVPEPSSWAMMVGGLAVLFVVVRRKTASRS